MSKGLKELKRMAYEIACCRCQYYINNKCTNKNECIWLDIEKELKALEIIKEKPWLVSEIIESKGDYKVYKSWCSVFRADMKSRATEEEYDLLKEVLL